MLELKKDIKGPGYYWRAGMRKTKEEWQKEFPHCNFDWDEWFVDPEAKKVVMENRMLRDIVNGVFEPAELYSSSYREAAYACLQKLTGIHNKRFESMIHQLDTLTTAFAAKDAEIERLKGFIRLAHDTGYVSGNLTNNPRVEKAWQEFKTANNL